MVAAHGRSYVVRERETAALKRSICQRREEKEAERNF